MPEKDFFRDTSVRYLGYANEVGESFRGVVPVKVVNATYGVAGVYVLADTADKAFKSLKKEGRLSRVVVDAGDALIWQTLASIVIPGITINRICKYSQGVLAKRASKIPLNARRWMTVGIGLASIPFIVTPIDMAVTLFMNLTYRKFV